MIIIKEMSKQPIAYESIFAAFVPQIIIQKTIDIQKKIAISKAKNSPKTRWPWLPLILPDFEQIAERTSLAAKH